jgi:hypothetical protein
MNNNPYSGILILATGMLGAIITATCVIVYVKLGSGIPLTMDTSDPLVMVGLVAGIVSIPVGLFMSKTLLAKARQHSEEEEKLRAMRTCVILRQGIWEAGVIVNLYAFWMGSTWVPVMVAGGIILVFLAFIPTPSRIKNDLEIG